MNESVKQKLLYIAPEVFKMAKNNYRRGAFRYSSDSAFIRAVLGDIIEKLNRR